MKRVGVLLNSKSCTVYLYDTVRELSHCEEIQLYYLLEEPSPNHGFWTRVQTIIRNKGLPGLLNLIFFTTLATVEWTLYSVFINRTSDHRRKCSLEGLGRVEDVFIEPIFSRSKQLVYYSNESIEKLGKLKLDIMLRGNARGIFRGKILTTAKNGILSFHHGDNRWNRGGPPAFWEVYGRKLTTGFVLQLLTENLDGGTILFRGNFTTRRSFIENEVNLYKESNPYLASIVLEFAMEGRFPESEENAIFSNEILKTPTVWQSLLYLWSTFWVFCKLLIERMVFRKHNRWSVAYIFSKGENAELRKGTIVQNPPNRFFADPFVVTSNNRTICFVEDYSFSDQRGKISAIEIFDKDNYEVLGPIITEPFHMSFPFVFEFEDKLYMTPETVEEQSIRLYVCVDFPRKWEFVREIMTQVNAVDPIIFEMSDTWWLFVNEAAKGCSDRNAKLMAYSSNDPTKGCWEPHSLNPILFDSETGRNGGLLQCSGGRVIRCRQKQGFNNYGESLSLAIVTELSNGKFSEKQLAIVEPNFFPNIKGCHHIHNSHNCVVYDFCRSETLV